MTNKKSSGKGRGQKGLRWQDPFLAREREKYENPLPSREFILQLVTEAGGPLPADDLAFRLDIEPDEEAESFRRRWVPCSAMANWS